MAEFVKVCTKSEIAPGTAKKMEVSGTEIAVFNVDGNFCAIQEVCPHRAGPLSEGGVEDGVVTCPWHGWQFRISDGVSPVNPAVKINCYQVKVEGNDIYVSPDSH